MRAWIIGSEGMLGKSFIQHWKDRADLITSNHRQVDITDESAILEFTNKYRPDVWINCTGYTQVDLAQTHEKEAFACNSDAPFNLAKAASKLENEYYKPLLIHFSTDYVFDGVASKPYTESDKPHPISVYGKSKFEGENRLMQNYKNFLLFRLSWLFGNYGHHFVKTMLGLMQTNELVKVVDDQIARPTYCNDVADTTWNMLEYRGLYHFCNSEAVSWHGFAQEIAHQARMLGASLKVQLIEPISSSELGRPATRPSYSVLDTSLIESTGIKIRPWTQALQECLQTLLEKND